MERVSQAGRGRLDGRGLASDLIGASEPIRTAREAIARVAATDRTVLISGETGTGKELAARAVHVLSRRASAPLVVVQCAAMPEGLIESELFGHERGAFTGAVRTRLGLFETADAGTLFLDEVPSMSPGLQGKLLRVLEQGTFVAVGGTRTRRTNVRLIAATNADLRTLVREGRFREDLFHRLAVLEVALPPLRDRPGDVPILAAHYVRKICGEEGLREKAIEPAALKALERYAWPGNVRELIHMIERAVLESPPGVVRLEDLSPDVRAAGQDGRAAAGRRRGLEPEPDLPLEPARFREIKHHAMERWERRFLERALESCAWNQSEVARRLHMSRRKLCEKIQRYGLRKDAG